MQIVYEVCIDQQFANEITNNTPEDTKDVTTYHHTTTTTTKTPWPLVRKRTRPTERPPLVNEI
jgi:hypothetical protein